MEYFPNIVKLKDRPIDIMGIVNITDDSYFAPSRHLAGNGCADIGKLIDSAGKLLSEGASIIDIGACSSRPGAAPIPQEIEWQRLKPALIAVRQEFPAAAISIDTSRSKIVQKSFDLIGKFIVNDISAGEDDPSMLSTVGRLGLQYIAMHKRGTPLTMQSLCSYSNVTKELLEYFEDFAAKATAAGISDWILDPGFGFAKTVEQSHQLLGDLHEFKRPFGGLQRRVLVGISRKSMIYKPLGITPEEALPATQALHLAALRNGADILRVHDVAPAVDTIKLYRSHS